MNQSSPVDKPRLFAMVLWYFNRIINAKAACQSSPYQHAPFPTDSGETKWKIYLPISLSHRRTKNTPRGIDERVLLPPSILKSVRWLSHKNARQNELLEKYPLFTQKRREFLLLQMPESKASDISSRAPRICSQNRHLKNTSPTRKWTRILTFGHEETKNTFYRCFRLETGFLPVFLNFGEITPTPTKARPFSEWQKIWLVLDEPKTNSEIVFCTIRWVL